MAVTKAQAGYSEGQPHCGVCKNFIAPKGGDDDAGATCKLVEGKIDEDMWCKLYEPKRRPSLAEGSR